MLRTANRLVVLEPKTILVFQVRGAERGDIKLSLRYYEGNSQLIVKVLECKGLKPFPRRVSCSKYLLQSTVFDFSSLPPPPPKKQFWEG